MIQGGNHNHTDEERSYYSLTRRVFDVLAPYYDAFNVVLRGVRKKTVCVADIGQGAKVIDVACGTGKQAFAFAEKGYDVTGLDITQSMLDVAVRKNRHANLKFDAGDATRLPYDDESFDATTISFALHDMLLSIRELVLREMVRVTKKDGALVIVDYDLPLNRISRFFVYHFVKLYERDYYVRFIHSDLDSLLVKSRIQITERHRKLFGAVRILKGRKTGG